MTANQIAYAKLQEEQRNNLAMEQETQRHNMMQEWLGLLGAQNTANANAETARSNQAREQETIRNNDLTNIRETSRIEIQWGEAGIHQQQLEESQRHNEAMELETQRHNESTETQQFVGMGVNFLGTLAGIASKLLLP